MRRGAPIKEGLDYFPKVLNFYEDDKIFDLLDEYGPLGVTIYDVILCIVYEKGYYANLSKDKLSRMVIKKIGNKWIKNQKVVVQVIDLCADLGLLCKDLVQQDIITSVGIQKRFYKVAIKLMKRQLYSDEFWLLEPIENNKSQQPLLNAPITQLNSEINGLNSEISGLNSEVSTPKRKEKETKINKTNKTNSNSQMKLFEQMIYDFSNDEEIRISLMDFVQMRKSLKNGALTERALKSILKKLEKLTDDYPVSSRESIIVEILDASIRNNWKDIYPLKDRNNANKNKFHNFEQRDTNYDELVTSQVMDWIND